MDYKEILKGIIDIIKSTEKSDLGFANICTYIGEHCPELKESEDERIRKGLIAYFKNNSVISSWAGLNVNKVLAWLEKQGEQKELSQSKVTKKSDQEWSEECDENLMMIEDRFSDYLDYIREDSSLTKHRKNTLKEEIIGYVNWLKTFKERLS